MVKDHTESRGGGTFTSWGAHLAKATQSVNTQGLPTSVAQSKLLLIVQGDKVTSVNIKNVLGKKGLSHPYIRQWKTHPWDCLCSGTWIHIVGPVKGWKGLVVERDLILGKKIQLIILITT